MNSGSATTITYSRTLRKKTSINNTGCLQQIYFSVIIESFPKTYEIYLSIVITVVIF